MSWHDLEAGNAELAAFGAARFKSGVAYLATIRKDGSPRLHPVTPIIGQGRLFLFMEPTSPKGRDLQRDGRYAMHAAVRDAGGGEGEFFIAGRAALVEDPEVRALAARSASYAPADRYILFALAVDRAGSTVYQEGGQPVRTHWQKRD